MTDMARSRVAIEYTNGGPGVMTLYWTSGFPAGPITSGLATEFHEELYETMELLGGAFAPGVTLRVQEEVDVLDPATGAITNVVTAAPSAGVTSGTGTGGNVSRATQACANLMTDNFQGGKRLRGRHFIGPLAGSSLENDGSVKLTIRNAIENAYVAITSGVGPRLAVWHRPTAKGLANGYYGDVTSVACKVNPAVLRSRRDS